ncbi:MAG: hypothetical protein Kow00120_15470 [Anaerolineae bacterium]
MLPTPEIPALTFRPLRRADAPAMHALERAAYTWGGFPVEPLADFEAAFDAPADPAADAIAAWDAAGRLVAYGWALDPRASAREHRIDLWHQVHPDHDRPALIDFLLAWMEARARQKAAALPDDGRPRWLNVWCYADQADRVARFAQHGYAPRWSEVFMQRDLSAPLPEPALPAGVALLGWTPARDDLMRQAMTAGFADRPGEAISPAVWARTYTGAASFCAPLSFVAALDPEEGVGAVLSHVNPEANARSLHTEGRIVLIAVRPDWRRRGVGAALLHAAMRGFRNLGLEYATLSVDVNNAPAISAYARVGFMEVRRYISFKKVIG